jgi:hypothetical protein
MAVLLQFYTTFKNCCNIQTQAICIWLTAAISLATILNSFVFFFGDAKFTQQLGIALR